MRHERIFILLIINMLSQSNQDSNFYYLNHEHIFQMRMQEEYNVQN